MFDVCANYANVENAVDVLKVAGFRNADISVLFPDKAGSKRFAHDQSTRALGSQRRPGNFRRDFAGAPPPPAHKEIEEMTRITTPFTVPAARAVAAAALLLRATRALANPALAATGDETDRQRPTGPRRFWPNPSSTEGGRPWPPAPPRWE